MTLIDAKPVPKVLDLGVPNATAVKFELREHEREVAPARLGVVV